MSFSPRVRPLSDGNSPWSSLLIKSQKTMPLASLFVDQPGNHVSGNWGVLRFGGHESSHMALKVIDRVTAGPLKLYLSPEVIYFASRLHGTKEMGSTCLGGRWSA